MKSNNFLDDGTHSYDVEARIPYESFPGVCATHTVTYTGAIKHKYIAISRLANQWAN